MNYVIDMDRAIVPKSDQLNADDLIAGGSITVKITDVTKGPSNEQPVEIHYEGDNGKPYRPGKSMSRVLRLVWGREGKAYIGKSMTLYRDAEVTFGKQKVGGLRISHMEGLKEEVTYSLTKSKGVKIPFVVKPLIVSEPKKTAVKPSAETLAAGNVAAGNGTEVYKEWISTLTEEQKATIRGEQNKIWTAAAKKADEKRQSELDETETSNEDDIPV